MKAFDRDIKRTASWMNLKFCHVLFLTEDDINSKMQLDL